MVRLLEVGPQLRESLPSTRRGLPTAQLGVLMPLAVKPACRTVDRRRPKPFPTCFPPGRREAAVFNAAWAQRRPRVDTLKIPARRAEYSL
jgi:hypothetical protein